MADNLARQALALSVIAIISLALFQIGGQHTNSTDPFLRTKID